SLLVRRNSLNARLLDRPAPSSLGRRSRKPAFEIVLRADAAELPHPLCVRNCTGRVGPSFLARGQHAAQTQNASPGMLPDEALEIVSRTRSDQNDRARFHP